MVFQAWVVAVQSIDKQDTTTYIMSLPYVFHTPACSGTFLSYSGTQTFTQRLGLYVSLPRCGYFWLEMVILNMILPFLPDCLKFWL